MIAVADHSEIFIHKPSRRPDYSTCYECQRSFRAKCEDQLCLELCDHCFENLRYLGEPILSVHVEARPLPVAL